MAQGDEDGSEDDLTYVRQEAYETPNFEKSKDDKMKRMKKELRKLAKSIHSFEIFSDEWRQLVLQLKTLAEACFNEANNKENDHDNDNGQNSNQHGQQNLHMSPHGYSNNQQSNSKIIGLSDSQGTLWDNSKKVIAVRIVLEEGKLNLVLRLLTNFRQIKDTSDRDEWTVKFETACNVSKIRIVTMKQLLETYEKSLGVLLFFCLKHKESLQILDTTTLVEHCARILRSPNKDNVAMMGYDPSGQSNMQRIPSFNAGMFDNGKYQEWLIMLYLRSLSSNLEEIDSFEEKTMSLFAKFGILSLALKFFQTYDAILSTEMIVTIVTFLDHCFGSESFNTEPEAFMTHCLHAPNDEGMISRKNNFNTEYNHTNDDNCNINNSNEDETSSKSDFYKALIQLNDEYVNDFIKSKLLDRKNVRNFQKQYRTAKRKAK